MLTEYYLGNILEENTKDINLSVFLFKYPSKDIYKE